MSQESLEATARPERPLTGDSLYEAVRRAVVLGVAGTAPDAPDAEAVLGAIGQWVPDEEVKHVEAGARHALVAQVKVAKLTPAKLQALAQLLLEHSPFEDSDEERLAAYLEALAEAATPPAA